jgi:transposase
MGDDIQNTKLDWQAIKEAGLALGIEPSIWPIDDLQITAAPDRPTGEPEVDVTDAEWAAIKHVLPADCGSERRVTISVGLFIVATGRPWTTLPARYGSWNAQRRRFSRWSHSGHWSKIADAIEAADVPDDRKRLYRRIANKAERQKAMLPEYRARVTGFRG